MAGLPVIEDRSPAGLTLLAAANLTRAGVAHGFFTRQGGVSGGIYASLNCGRGSRDDKEHVEENRSRVASRLAVAREALIGPRQAHTATAVVASKVWTLAEAPEADAIVTATPGLAIAVLSADCAPILVADHQAGVAAAIHAGWKGARAGVVRAAIDTMVTLGAEPSRIAAAIGPAISKAAYEVGPEFRDAFIGDDAGNGRFFSQDANQPRPHFDLNGYVHARLAECGIEDICGLALCTCENESLFFSNRRAGHRGEPDYGRQISAIVVP